MAGRWDLPHQQKKVPIKCTIVCPFCLPVRPHSRLLVRPGLLMDHTQWDVDTGTNNKATRICHADCPYVKHLQRPPSRAASRCSVPLSPTRARSRTRSAPSVSCTRAPRQDDRHIRDLTKHNEKKNTARFLIQVINARLMN